MNIKAEYLKNKYISTAGMFHMLSTLLVWKDSIGKRQRAHRWYQELGFQDRDNHHMS